MSEGQSTSTSSAVDIPAAPADNASLFEEVDEGGGQSLKLLNGEPNKRRIRRHLNMIAGIKHDEEILIPSNIPLNYKGSVDLAEIQRIKGTDTFRILPQKRGNGIITIHNKKTGQILVELRLDIRDQSIEKSMREIQALLGDIEGVEYKLVNDKILLDGFVLLPKDLIRIGNVIKQFGPDVVKSLVTLSPIARRKIVEYIARDVNNPEVQISAVGDFIKLEGMVNSEEEKSRIMSIVNIYMPDIVTDEVTGLDNVKIQGRRPSNNVEGFILDMIHVRKDEEKVVPPPKMIQIVVHFVEFSDRYLKNFDFIFSPSITGIGQQASAPRAPTTVGEIASIVNNLLPKINWARNHGFIRLLDTASVLTQDKANGNINRVLTVSNGQVAVAPAGSTAPPVPLTSTSYQLSLDASPVIKSERSGLIEMILKVSTVNGTESIKPTTNINTKISVRDRQSAAFGGIISKKSENQYGGPSNTQNAIITLNHGKKFEKSTSNFVVFVTPTIKSSASAGVEQVKKKFRMKE